MSDKSESSESSELPKYMWNFISDVEESVPDATLEEHCRPNTWQDGTDGRNPQAKEGRVQDTAIEKDVSSNAWREDLKRLELLKKDDLSTLSKFNEMPRRDQLIFLMYITRKFGAYVNRDSWVDRLKHWTNKFATPNDERGAWARRLRGVVKFMDLDFLFNSDFPICRRFMNEELREFLNLNKNGTMDYTWDDVYEKAGWSETPSLYAAYHQYEVPIDGGYHNNAKFLHIDGREAIFSYDRKRVNTHYR